MKEHPMSYSENIDADGVIHAPPTDLGEDEDEGCLVGDERAIVTPGDYEATYVRHETRLLMSGAAPKLVVWFRIMTPGPCEGVELPRYYNVLALNGRPRPSGGFKVGAGSDYYSDLVSIVGKPDRRDRLSPIAFKGRVLRIRVRSVNSSWSGKNRPDKLRYSVVDRIVKEV